MCWAPVLQSPCLLSTGLALVFPVLSSPWPDPAHLAWSEKCQTEGQEQFLGWLATLGCTTGILLAPVQLAACPLGPQRSAAGVGSSASGPLLTCAGCCLQHALAFHPNSSNWMVEAEVLRYFCKTAFKSLVAAVGQSTWSNSMGRMKIRYVFKLCS